MLFSSVDLGIEPSWCFALWLVLLLLIIAVGIILTTGFLTAGIKQMIEEPHRRPHATLKLILAAVVPATYAGLYLYMTG